MVDPARMVIINIFALVLFCLIWGIYRYFFSNKKVSLFIVLITISIVPLINVFRPGVYESSDWFLHTYRAVSFFSALKEGNIMPSWSEGLHATYGYPIFIFNYILPYYFLSALYSIGLSFIVSMKIFLASNFILSGIFFYFWSKEVFKNSFAAFFSAVLYLFVPYHLVDQNFRVSTGEILAFTIFPILLYFLIKLRQKGNLFFASLVVLSLVLLFFSHPAITVISLPILIGYSSMLLFEDSEKSIKKIFLFIGSFLTGILLSAPVWYAHIFLTQYTYHTKQDATVFFPQLRELFYTPWQYGFLFQGHKGELGYIIGYVQLVIVAYCIVQLLRKKIPSKYFLSIIFWLTTIVLYVFLITSFSEFIWNFFPLLRLAQFSYRLLFVVAVATSIIGGYFSLIVKNKKIIIVILVFVVVSTILNWGNRKMISFSNDTYIYNLPLATYEGEAFPEALPKWWNSNQKELWTKSIPQYHAEIIQGVGKIYERSRTSTKHVYDITAETSLYIKENTAYFPGWVVTIDRNVVDINYVDTNYPGRIMFTVTPGMHTIIVAYRDIPYYALTKRITEGGLLLIVLYVISTIIFNKKNI